jgi:hypothetical protein
MLDIQATVSAMVEATAIGVESSGEILANGVEIGVEVVSVVAESTGNLWELLFEVLLSWL